MRFLGLSLHSRSTALRLDSSILSMLAYCLGLKYPRSSIIGAIVVQEEVAASVSGKMSKFGDNGPLLSLLGMFCRAEAESKVVLKEAQQQYLATLTCAPSSRRDFN